MKGGLIRAVALIAVALGYYGILVYQSGVTLNFQESRRDSVQVSNLPNDSKTRINKEYRHNITLDDIFIAVKTTSLYHNIRLPAILKTWFQLAKNQTWFFTDSNDTKLDEITNGHMINTECPSGHNLLHLCCKTSAEYDYFLKSNKKWFCHFDDDNYVNVPRLVEVLRRFNPQRNYYFGRRSTRMPLRILIKPSNMKVKFWFATFGAGLCISRSLALKMLHVAGGGKFISVCSHLWYPDDVTMGFIIEHLMQTKLIVLPEFHSHYDKMSLLPKNDLHKQLSFSYALKDKKNNVLNITGFDEEQDPTRFLSLHCFLFPHFEFCKTSQRTAQKNIES